MSLNNNLYREILSPLDQFEIRDLISLDAPTVLAGKHTMWVKLSNSGELLKILILSHIWKYMSGWSNCSGIVTSQNIHESVMGYRGSKSGNLSVKEQRVDGSCTGALSPVLRCTLMGFERNYQVKIPSNLLFRRQYSTNKITRRTSSVGNSTSGIYVQRSPFGLEGVLREKDKLNLINPSFITGFMDGEGSFMVSVLKYPTFRTGWKVQARFVITQHERDIELIKNIQSFFTLKGIRGVNGGSSEVIGNVDPKGKDQVYLRVTSLEQITNVIIPHFDKYPLITQKKADFQLFKLVVNIMNNKEHLTTEGLDKIVSLKASMNKGLSKDLKEAFPNVIPFQRPIVKGETIKDPYWLAGFVTGEGCFHVRLRETPDNSKKYVELIFTVGQHIRDESLMKSLVDYLGCGRISVSKGAISYTCSKFSDITEKLLPFFHKHQVLGVKSKDFNSLSKISEIIKSKAHLTNEGFNQIREIKASFK